MIESRKFVAAAILAGLALIVAGLMISPMSRAHAASTDSEADIAAQRIGGAFATISDQAVNPAIAAAATRAVKGDLARTADCATATWPNIDASCLVDRRRLAGAARAHHHRRLPGRPVDHRSPAHPDRRGCAALTHEPATARKWTRAPQYPTPRPVLRPHLAPLRPPLVRSAGAGRGDRPGVVECGSPTKSFWSEEFRSPSRRPSRSPLSCF